MGAVDGGRRKAVDRASAAQVEISGVSGRVTMKFPPFHGGNTEFEISYGTPSISNIYNRSAEIGVPLVSRASDWFSPIAPGVIAWPYNA